MVKTPMFVNYVVFVYGAPHVRDMPLVWSSIQRNCLLQNIKIVLLGDFNQVEYKHQKKGGPKCYLGSNKFSHWCIINRLTHITLQGC